MAPSYGAVGREELRTQVTVSPMLQARVAASRRNVAPRSFPDSHGVTTRSGACAAAAWSRAPHRPSIGRLGNSVEARRSAAPECAVSNHRRRWPGSSASAFPRPRRRGLGRAARDGADHAERDAAVEIDRLPVRPGIGRGRREGSTRDAMELIMRSAAPASKGCLLCIRNGYIVRPWRRGALRTPR